MASISTSSPHAHKAHPFPSSDVLTMEADVNGNAQSDSVSLNQSAYQDNTLAASSTPTLNGSRLSSPPSDRLQSAADNAVAAAQTSADPAVEAPTDLPSTSTVSLHIVPASSVRDDPTPSIDPESPTTEMQPEDEMDLVVTSAAVEADGAQATSVTETITPNPESGITNTAGIPPDMGLLSTAETTALPSHLGPQHDSIMAEAPIQEHLQEPSSAFTVGENTEQIESPNKTRAREDDEVNGSVNKRAKAAVDTTAPANNEPGHDVEPNGRIRPREDDEEGGSPASKRTKLEENEEGLSELKLSEGSDHAVVPVENGGQNLDTLAGQVTSPEAGASTIQYDAEPMTTPQQKALAEIIKNVKKVKDAKPFAKPVDYIALGIPTYPDIIKNPMDIETIEKRLKGSEYHSVADLVSDFDLMIQNCYTFNGSQHAVSISASNLQAYFKKALQKIPARDVPQVASAEKKAKRPSVGARQAPDAPRRPSRVSGGAARSPTVEKSNDAFALGPDGTPVIRRDSTLGDRPKREIHRPTKDLPYASAKPRRKKFQQELRFVDHIIAEMNKPKYNGLSWPFTAPVDPVALNIPTYFSIIKKPMDFGTISNKQKTNQYENAKDFKSDVDLMFDNCFRFNPASDNIHQMGKSYQEVFKRLWAEKDDWLAENAPTSSPQSPGMTPDSHDEDADVDEEGEEFDHREAELRQIHQQIQALHQRATDIYGKVPNQKAVVPKASSRKNSSKPMKSAGKAGRKSGSLSGPGTKAAPKPAKKPAKVKPLTQDEKAEIQEKVERLTDQHPEKAGDLVKIIKENDPKFANLAEDEIELELEELEVDVARMLLKYVRKFYPLAQVYAPPDDDDFIEPERRAAKNAAATSSRKKNKPMTKVQQETDMSAIRNKLNQFGNPTTAGEQSSDPQPQESSDDDDSGSESEEE